MEEAAAIRSGAAQPGGFGQAAGGHGGGSGRISVPRRGYQIRMRPIASFRFLDPRRGQDGTAAKPGRPDVPTATTAMVRIDNEANTWRSTL